MQRFRRWSQFVPKIVQWILIVGGSFAIAAFVLWQGGVNIGTIAVAAALLVNMVYFLWREIRARRANILLRKGMELAQLKRWNEALTVFDQVLKLNPQDLRTVYYKGLACMWLKRYGEALPLFDRALVLDPDNTSVLQSKSFTFLCLNCFENAVEVSGKSLRSNPKNAAAWNIRTIALIRLQRFDEALTEVNQALTVCPAFLTFWINKASLLCDDLHRYGEAIGFCQEGITSRIELASMWAIKGDALHALGRAAEARLGYEQALAFTPDDFIGWTARGRALLGLERFEDALAAINHAITLNANSPMTHRRKAAALRALGREEEAREAERQAAALERDASV
jgi:tetratricopeptide (TPR) repeat protein